MSYSGKYTPLQLNLLGELMDGKVFRLNPTATAYHGTWTPSGYSHGSLVNDTVLKDFSSALAKLAVRLTEGGTDADGNAIAQTPNPTFFRRAIRIGSAGNSVAALANSIPASFNPSKYLSGWVSSFTNIDDNTTNSDNYFKDGFIATIARQAYYEMWPNISNGLGIVRMLSQSNGWAKQTNSLIFSSIGSKVFLKGAYSNINDLTTADVSGVSVAFRDFGEDLINLGKSIDLSTIDTFGLPATFLLNLQSKNALTEPVKYSLLYAGLTIEELQTILLKRDVATPAQNTLIYKGLEYIEGDELTSVLQILNVQTQGLKTLADLLNVKKMFPKSYSTLTVPSYSNETVSAKIYDFIYTNGGVNSRLEDYSSYFYNSVPADIAKPASALSYTLQQINNIKRVDFENFAQVVYHLEVTNKDLNLINSEAGVPINNSSVNKILSRIAFGSGNGGSYRMSDFFGAASGVSYNDEYAKIKEFINQLTTPTLRTLYKSLNDNATSGSDAQVTTILNNIDTELKSIYAKNVIKAEALNYFWSRIGKQLKVEQASIQRCVHTIESITNISGDTMFEYLGYVQSKESYALETDYCEMAQVIEGISDTSTIGGQSSIGAMREARNARRLIDAGIEPDNDIGDVDRTACAYATAIVVNGHVIGVDVVNGGTGYDQNNPPNVYCSDPTVKLSAVITQMGTVSETVGGYQILGGTISSINIDSIGTKVPDTATIIIDCPPKPKKIGSNPVAGFFNDNPYIGAVPDNLVPSPTASFTTEEAIKEITIGNCECWVE